MRAAHVFPVRVRAVSPLLGCDAVTTFGYRAESADGWRGPFRRNYRAARTDARVHNREGRTSDDRK